MRNRSSPGALFTIMQTLTKDQKECVRKMGFGSLLKMKFIEVPGALSLYVLEKYNSFDNTINLPCGTINVTKESVHQIMGLPMGKTQFDDLPYPDIEDNCYIDWSSRYADKNHIRLNEIKTQIIQSKEADMNFKMDFIVVMINALIESSSHGKCNYTDIRYIMENTDVKDIDWCSYLIKSLNKNKHLYDPEKPNANFLGPSAYLVV